MTKPVFTRAGLIAIAVWAAAGGAALAQTASDPAPVTVEIDGAESPERLKELLGTLARDGRPVVVRLRAKTGAATSSGGAAPGELMLIESIWQGFQVGLERGNAGVRRIPELGGDLERAWSARQNASTVLDAASKLVAVLIAGLAAALAVVGLWSRLLRPVVLRPGAPLWRRLKPALLRTIGDAIAIVAAIYVARSVAASLIPSPDVTKLMAEGLVGVLTAFGIHMTAGRLFLWPVAENVRVVPMPRAEMHFKLLVVYALAAPFSVAATAVLSSVASSAGPIAGLAAVVAVVVSLYKAWWFWLGRHDIAALVLSGADHPPGPSPLRRLVATTVPWLNIGIVVLIWAVGRIAAGMPEAAPFGVAAGITQLVVVIVPLLATGIAQLARDAIAAREAEHQRRPLTHALAVAGQQGASIAVWIAGLAFVAQIWGDNLMSPESSGVVTLLKQFSTLITVALAGWVFWSFVKALFDAYRPRQASLVPGQDEEHVPEVQSRLSTVLPLVRGFALGIVVGVAVLAILSSLGIDIAPLLAGFGILGLAISFGSQTLVRDVVAGIFFMADDAFRVGEYIEAGKLKGTVEKISLRSVRLRHQSGLVHTVPYGQLEAITNASRDWATMKFTIRLDRSANIEKARKLIKRVGADMQADPELGGDFILPLKMQGIQTIEDNALVIRLKFTAKPLRPTWVQREALKRVYAALTAAEIPFASNAVTVRGASAGAEAAGVAGVKEKVGVK